MIASRRQPSATRKNIASKTLFLSTVLIRMDDRKLSCCVMPMLAGHFIAVPPPPAPGFILPVLNWALHRRMVLSHSRPIPYQPMFAKEQSPIVEHTPLVRIPQRPQSPAKRHDYQALNVCTVNGQVHSAFTTEGGEVTVSRDDNSDAVVSQAIFFKVRSFAKLKPQ